jgi:hypothetical protein
MHRLILRVDANTQVDHRDGNGLNNTRGNLRPATHAQNQHNSRLRKDNQSGFKGVHRQGNRWVARIRVDGEQKHLGSFRTPEEAARAYDAAALRLRGEYARLNF